MFAKRLLQKATHHSQNNVHRGVTLADLDLQIAIHYGIPSTASVLAFDPIQSLLAIGTLDGRIKVIGGDNIEALLISPKQFPFKYLEFLQNQGLLVSISNDNDIQVWNLESRCIASSLQWESNITAFSVIYASHFMYIGDEYGTMSVLKYQAEGELLQLPYHISVDHLTEAAALSIPSHQPIVGVLPQPCSSGQRVLIAYASGLLILWDVVKARIIVVRGDKVLQLKDGVVDFPNEAHTDLPGDASEQHLEEKEISALCWASSSGSILAVGYIDGDILFWKTSSASTGKGKQAGSCNEVAKLQLSSAERRLPVIVLHWSANSKSHNDCDGQLFIYGGSEIGSEEVITVLSLEWSTGAETLRCVGRVDLTLNGSFADMIFLPTAATTGNNHAAALFVLTNPGQLHFFDDARLSASLSQKEKRMSVSAVEFPMVVPTANPYMTVAKLSNLPSDGKSYNALSKIASLMKSGPTPILVGATRWPFTGGIANRSLCAEENRVERVYVAGYQDGSVQIWDATYPVLSLICVLESEVNGVKVAGSSASVSNIDFCSLTLRLAVGNECGLVHIYNLNGSLDETSFHFVMETKREVHNLPQGKGQCCQAIFGLLNSPVQALQFTSCGAKLAVGYNCGRVAVLDMKSLSVLCLTDCVSAPSSPIISVTWKAFMNSNGNVRSPKKPGSNFPDNSVEELIFVLSKDAKVYAINGVTGTMVSSRPVHLKEESTVISLHVIEGNAAPSGLSNKKKPQQLPKDDTSGNEPSQDTTSTGIDHNEAEHHSSASHSGESSKDSMVLLCCKDTVRLYHTKSLVQGEKKCMSKIKLAKPCCWMTTFKKDERVCGLTLLYQTGDIEIRSLPDLELVKESSLRSILRWSFKANMEKTISSTDNGLISLVNGCELAFISLLACENNFRIPESLPSLHDNVLAAAAEAAITFSSNQKKKQGAPGILGGIVKGLKGGKVNHTNDGTSASKSYYSHLEGAFSRNPFPDSSPITDNQEVVELNIDDIEIDEPVTLASTSTSRPQRNQREKGSEREKLLDGAGAEITPRLRTPEEIMATYRKAGDASSVAGQARNKLLERQEKLERISKRTEELQSGAEDFASLANELVKAMENRKWYHI
ncbi:Syntaxin-binding protein 5-like [Actinidia chinensis var. chinensis]|uniref:Syntaxin-binding protein 5-like n=1 Tax=Actinidia chinensis var. chinensis TaxID=1590841 RepID=A0A2R6RXF7_ACTCC|nr:Syntaxin-binding protein 5-like [Actinidia chinensis var. chinensis]